MALYLLTLVCIPCSDTAIAEECFTPMTMNKSHDCHDTEKDICSPFCTCSCCSSQVIVTIYFPFANSIPGTPNQFLELTQVSFTDPSYSIWQPPRRG